MHTFELYRSGAPLRSILNSASPIRENGQIYHGHARWNIDWRYRWNEDKNGRCAITSVSTSLTALITLPALHTADAKIKRKFDTYLQALRNHELGHVQIARTAAKMVDARIQSLSPASSCPALEQEANRLGYRLVEEARQAEKRYDADTGHGKTQGAWLDGTDNN